MSRWIERALLTLGVLCLGWYAAVHVAARFDQAAQYRELDELRAERAAAPVPVAAPRRVPEPREVLGKIEIPRLGLSTIVRSGVDEGTLRLAAGHVPETALPGAPGNAALAAHRDTFFRPLRHVRLGDRVRVTTQDGVFDYKVSDTRIVNPEDVSVLEPTTERTLTLITCYPFNYVGSAPQRFVVRATADVVEARAAPAVTPAVFKIVEPAPVAKQVVKPAKKANATRHVAKGKTAKLKPKPKKKGFFGKLFGAFKAGK